MGITVSEPTGVDRDVWEVLKADPEYGYFIQSGGPKGNPQSEERPDDGDSGRRSRTTSR